VQCLLPIENGTKQMQMTISSLEKQLCAPGKAFLGQTKNISLLIDIRVLAVIFQVGCLLFIEKTEVCCLYFFMSKLAITITNLKKQLCECKRVFLE
jgi:hypothetical protein